MKGHLCSSGLSDYLRATAVSSASLADGSKEHLPIGEVTHKYQRKGIAMNWWYVEVRVRSAFLLFYQRLCWMLISLQNFCTSC